MICPKQKADEARITNHYSDVRIGAMASQITSPTIVYSTVYLGADQRKYQRSASLAFVRGIHRWPGNSPHKGPVTRKMFDLMTSSCIPYVSVLKWISRMVVFFSEKATTSLILAVKAGNMDIVNLLLNEDITFITKKNSKGVSHATCSH